jgi:N-acylneuraminate cytidylyltransferase
MSNVLAIVPARSGSRGIPNKNFRELCGVSPVERATTVAKLVADQVIISSDNPYALANWNSLVTWERLLLAPAPLHTDTCKMIDVVRDVLDRVPGPEDQIIVLLQPTQPLRTPAHVQAAIQLLTAGARCVVSVTPATSPDKLWKHDLHEGAMYPWVDTSVIERRQDARPAFKADGTVYAWRRRDDYWDWPFTPLLIPPEETQALDTPADWAEAERRLRDRVGHPA